MDTQQRYALSGFILLILAATLYLGVPSEIVLPIIGAICTALGLAFPVKDTTKDVIKILNNHR